MNVYEEIFNRMKSLANPCYINIFSGDDQKKDKKVYSEHYNLHKVNTNEIITQTEIQNVGSFGVFMNFNLLEKPQRKNDNITKILYIFIDLDNAQEEHNILIRDNLLKKGIKYSYNCKSGGGYHFLIPVELLPNQKDKVKGFLTYLQHNVCDKVDVATHTNERLLRCPESIHNKNKEPFNLETIEHLEYNKNEIEKNNELILEYQENTKKGEIEEKYLIDIKREDIFFSTLLNNQDKWDLYIKYLNNSVGRNDIFIKNLGIFICKNLSYKEKAILFINKFEAARIGALNGWINKGTSQNMSINYYEIIKWSRKYDLKEFIILLEEQTKTSFLDCYELYYVEDEKSDTNCLLYYPQRNYYVQKSLNDVILNIFYECKERGIDLITELNIKSIYDDWDKFNFKKQLNLILDQIRRIIEQENRIRLVYNINYEPSENKFIYHNGKKYFNSYNKSSLIDYYKKSETYYFPNIKELILNLCGGEIKNYDYFCKWVAWLIQNPLEKLPTAIILQGQQGSGKGTLKNLILDNIFGNNVQEINQTHLESQFNDYLLGKQIIVANEVMHNDNRQTLPNILKNLVTDPEITINQKFKKSITGKNYTHWIFCTNSDNPIKIDKDDRRYSVFYSNKMTKTLAKNIRENLDYELKEFLCYLKDIDVTFEEVSEPIMTEAKEEIIELNKDSIDKFKDYLTQFNNFTESWISLFNNDSNFSIVSDFGDGQRYLHTDLFYLMYEKYCEKYKERGLYAKQNFCKKVGNYKVKSIPKWRDNKTFRMYNLDTIEEVFMC